MHEPKARFSAKLSEPHGSGLVEQSPLNWLRHCEPWVRDWQCEPEPHGSGLVEQSPSNYLRHCEPWVRGWQCEPWVRALVVAAVVLAAVVVAAVAPWSSL
eukprot:15363223-Heterocapsa_arctica.AAC.1